MLKELKVNEEACTQCKTCTEVCFTNVIEWDEENQKPYAKYPLDCQVCCICEAACPEKALEVVPDWSKKYYPSYLSTMRGRQ